MARYPSPRPDRHSCSTLEQIVPLLDRSHRERTGLFWAEGCRSFFGALEQGWTVRSVVICSKLLRSHQAWSALRNLPSPLRLSETEFRLLSRRLEPDGIGIVCEQRWSPLVKQNPTEGKTPDIWVALDSIRTPGNLGTLMRTCAAVGARGVMLIGGEADPYDPATIRASMGAVLSVDLIRTSARALAGWKSRRRVRFVGASPNAQKSYRHISTRGPVVLMMGSERSGLRSRQIELCDEIVRLPMTQAVDSLNLAVATSILLYELSVRHSVQLQC